MLVRGRFGGSAVLICIVLGAGCGGGGSDGPVFPLTSQMRQLQVGDSCSYYIEGELTPLQGPPAPLTGSVVHKITARSGNAITVTHDLTINIYGQSNEVLQTVKEQENPDGSIVEISDNNGANGSTRTVTSNTFIQPGTLALALSATGLTTFSNGNTVKNALQVTGTQQVRNTLGTFDTWVENRSAQTNYGFSSQLTDYVDPALGFFVARTETDKDTSIGTETIEYVLTATTVRAF